LRKNWPKGEDKRPDFRCKIVLPFSEPELEFLNRFLDRGEIQPSLLTSDEDLAKRIKNHPLIEWKAMNVRQYKKK
jgi:hypothetical protein